MTTKPRSGRNLANLEQSMASKGVRAPGEVAKTIGRDPHGAKKITVMSGQGKRVASLKEIQAYRSVK